jgi:hypothetical protein
MPPKVHQACVDDAWLHTRNFPLGVDFQNAIDVLGKIDHHCHVTALTGQAGAAAARDDRRPVPVTGRHGFDHVVDAARNHHADRHLTIVGGVGGVESPAAIVESDLAFDLLSQVGRQRAGVHLRGLDCRCFLRRREREIESHKHPLSVFQGLIASRLRALPLMGLGTPPFEE